MEKVFNESQLSELSELWPRARISSLVAPRLWSFLSAFSPFKDHSSLLVIGRLNLATTALALNPQ
jgi:hypothetical protein